ncbi:MAG: hypothetical protein IOC63_11035 [Methylobacterium sp.]|nr:hypothetical protein [Methylobacterium sp.]
MAYTFNLNSVATGRHYSWTIQNEDIVFDPHRHVLAFTVRFDDGTTRTFALGNDGGFVRRLLSTKLDELAGAITGMRIGSSYGLIGTAFGAVAGWVATEVLENVALANADYYDEHGNKTFHGVIRV